jgi:hypothetical protein
MLNLLSMKSRHSIVHAQAYVKVCNDNSHQLYQNTAKIKDTRIMDCQELQSDNEAGGKC